MRKTTGFWLFLAGGAALFGGCGGDDAETGATGAGGGDSATSSTTATSATATTSVTTTTSTGMTGDGDDTCATAKSFDFGTSEDGELDPTGDQDHFKFEGKKGQVLMFDIDAQVVDDAQYDVNHIDAVVTLYDAAGNQVAQNNDPIIYATNDSRLYTILPEDGSYCLRITECWTGISNPGSTCADPKDKAFTSYSLFPYELDESVEGLVADAELGDDETTATLVEYAANSSGGYYTTEIWGGFKSETDVDVFSFTLPLDTEVQEGRADGNFYIVPSGVDESGSTTPVGDLYIVDPADPTSRWASISGTKNTSMSPPLELGKEYFLFVQHPGGAAGANDFYFLRHYGADGNPLEAEVGAAATNDSIATAETLLPSDIGGGQLAVYIEGDLASGAADVDYFQATVPLGMATGSVVCSAQRRGSGLRGLKASLQNSDGTQAFAGATDTETETSSVSFNGPVTAGATVIYKIEAASQSPTVTSAFYRCGLYFY